MKKEYKKAKYTRVHILISLRIAKAYRTISHEALCIITPINIKAEEAVALYRVSQGECARLREGVPYVKVYRYNPKHLCPKLNG